MFRTIRPYLITFVIAAVVVTAFFVVVGPLFTTSGPAKAEVIGLVDSKLVAGKPGELPVSVDNTGDSEITPICLGATFSAPVTVQRVVFNNNESLPFRDGKVCGGGLVGQETISVVFTVTTNTAGPLQVTVTPMTGNTAVGAPLHATVTVAPSEG